MNYFHTMLLGFQAMTYAALGRVEDAVGELRSVVQRDVPQSGNAPKIVLATTVSTTPG